MMNIFIKRESLDINSEIQRLDKFYLKFSSLGIKGRTEEEPKESQVSYLY